MLQEKMAIKLLEFLNLCNEHPSIYLIFHQSLKDVLTIPKALGNSNKKWNKMSATEWLVLKSQGWMQWLALWEAEVGES